MGILSSMGVNNGLTDFLAAHRGALTQFGTGLASGPTLAQGIALGTQGLAQGSQQDTAYATSQKEEKARQDAINQTAAFLHAKGYDDLVPLVGAGQGSAALSEAFSRMKGVAPQPPQYIKGDDGTVLVAQNGKITTGYTPPAADPANAPPVVSFGANGQPDPAAQDAFLKTLDPQFANIVKGVANYELDPTKITTLRGDQRQKLVEAVKAYDPTYDGTQFGVRVGVRKDFTSGQSAINLKAANTLIGHLSELKKASEALGNGSFPLLNAAGNTWKSQTGNAAPTTYGVAAQASADELAKVFKGGGASDVESIKGWQSKLDQNASPDQQQAAIREAVNLLESRVAALRDQYQAGTGKPADFSFLNEKSAKALKDLGIDPADVDPYYGKGPSLFSGDAPGDGGASGGADAVTAADRLLQSGKY